MVSSLSFGLPRARPQTGQLVSRKSISSAESEPEVNWESVSGVITLLVDGHEELLEIDPECGPKVLTANGDMQFFELRNINACEVTAVEIPQKTWKDYTSSEKKVLSHLAAKKNHTMRAWAAPQLTQEGLLAQREALRAQEETAVRELANRCDKEMARTAIKWQPISFDVVTANHDKVAPGMFYGLEFPFSAKTLQEFGPDWLTEAFQKAGSLEQGNRVTHVKIERDIKVTAGNNAGKFLFSVRYARDRPGLHTKLFAKVPFAMTKDTKQDRLSSSVLKQPMDFFEINTYRLVETALPMKTPKFYFGDISNQTSNYILITERVPFVEIDGKKRSRALKAFEVEGPYDKCKDFELRSPAKEYYTVIMQVSARIAAFDKTGKMGSREFLALNFGTPPAPPGRPEAWGINPSGPSGGEAQAVMAKLKTAIQFFSETASVVFAPYVASESFIDKFTKTMMTFSAYTREIEFWKHEDLDYIALAHANLNVDNGYFWRDEAGRLDCGVLDWGGFGAGCLGHKIWWYLNCAEWEEIKSNLGHFLESFIATYKDSGGPSLDFASLELMAKLTCLGNLMFMVAAVPDCLRQCPASSWRTIKDRHDPRIAENVGGKSTLRTTLRVMDNGLRMIEELEADKELQKWIDTIWVGKFGKVAKTQNAIFGEGS
eukprot:TRINITY_DN80084_c0_g1_i1.p1 TRINITY_DN80084_c0_g1~~TRINITY_DN80084_c0_g1_i1.p1  ORF type:complete len:659 (-),score=158.66 TRINITY_DN80084_c0_g1_i1:108-2084(-)